MIESMKGGRFLNLKEIEAYEFLKNLSKSSQQWDYFQRDRNTRRARLHEISIDMSINLKLDSFTMKIEALSLAKAVEPLMSIKKEVCNFCASPMHPTSYCSSQPAYPEQFPEQANMA